jgi:hypothetical protein
MDTASRLAPRASRLAVRGSRFAVRGSRFAPGWRLAARARLAARGSRPAGGSRLAPGWRLAPRLARGARVAAGGWLGPTGRRSPAPTCGWRPKLPFRPNSCCGPICPSPLRRKRPFRPKRPLRACRLRVPAGERLAEQSTRPEVSPASRACRQFAKPNSRHAERRAQVPAHVVNWPRPSGRHAGWRAQVPGRVVGWPSRTVDSPSDKSGFPGVSSIRRVDRSTRRATSPHFRACRRFAEAEWSTRRMASPTPRACRPFTEPEPPRHTSAAAHHPTRMSPPACRRPAEARRLTSPA